MVAYAILGKLRPLPILTEFASIVRPPQTRFNIPYLRNVTIFIMGLPNMDRISFILRKSEREQAEAIAQHTTRFNKRQFKTPATSSASSQAPPTHPALHIQSLSLLSRSLAAAHPPTPHTTVTQPAATSTQQQSIQDLNAQQAPPTRQVLQNNQNQRQPPPQRQLQRQPQRQPQGPLQFQRLTAPATRAHRGEPRYLPLKWRPLPPRMHTRHDDVTHYHAPCTYGWEGSEERWFREAEAHVGTIDHTWAASGGGVIRNFRAEMEEWDRIVREEGEERVEDAGQNTTYRQLGHEHRRQNSGIAEGGSRGVVGGVADSGEDDETEDVGKEMRASGARGLIPRRR
jgi:hypothetical protein